MLVGQDVQIQELIILEYEIFIERLCHLRATATQGSLSGIRFLLAGAHRTFDEVEKNRADLRLIADECEKTVLFVSLT